MAESCKSITCTVTIETSQNLNSISKSVYRSCRLTLGRNEFREVILRIGAEKSTKKFCLKDIALHKKYVKDGKATITFRNLNFSILISNSQPSSLFLFLRTLATKVRINEQKKLKISMRKKMLSERQRVFDEISPISLKDLNLLNAELCKEGKPHLPIINESNKLLKNLQDDSNVCEQDKENRLPKQLQQSKSGHSYKSAKLTSDQRRVISAVLSGSNVFFTGNAGTGKSFLLKEIISVLPQVKTVVTASTGIAACQIGGITLHSFAGIGTGASSVEQCVQLVKRRPVLKQWKTCRHLIIDEISMVDGEFFVKLEEVARIVRENSEPFGGIQLIFTGDFFQLPPVTKNGDPKFCFQTAAWSKCIYQSIVLHEVKRQVDPIFINILNEIRIGRCSSHSEIILRNTASNIIEKDGIQATRLCTHTEDVETINEAKLKQLDGQMKRFASYDSDSLLSSFMDKCSPVKSLLDVKNGAQVMLVKNLDLEKGLVNGSRGIVVGFEKNGSNQELPVVKFFNGAKMCMKYEKFIIKASGGTFLHRKQLPLKLAWAISIHKSQGMTLDCIELSLSRVFECGQAYVALSRARSLQGLRVTHFSKDKVTANKHVMKFYEELEQMQPRPVGLQLKKSRLH